MYVLSLSASRFVGPYFTATYRPSFYCKAGSTSPADTMPQNTSVSSALSVSAVPRAFFTLNFGTSRIGSLATYFLDRQNLKKVLK